MFFSVILFVMLGLSGCSWLLKVSLLWLFFIVDRVRCVGLVLVVVESWVVLMLILFSLIDWVGVVLVLLC